MNAMIMAGPIELLLIVLLGGGGIGLPVGMPPGPQDPLLAKVAPEECLFYTSWAGVAEPDPNSPNQTEQLLAEPEVQHLFAEVERVIRTAVHEAALEEDPQAAALADDAADWVKTALTRPAAVFVSKVQIGPTGPTVEAGALVNVGEDAAAELKTTLEKYQAMFLDEAAQPVQIGGQGWHRLTLDPQAPPIFWGVRGRYFIIGVGEGAIEGILQRAGTEPPEWLTEIGRQLPVERRSTVAYVNVKAITDILPPLAGPDDGAEVTKLLGALGLDNVTQVASVTGLDEHAFVSRTLVGLNGEPKGLLSFAAAEPLAAGDLGPIPRDATVALATRLDADQVFETFLSIIEQIDPRAVEDVHQGLDEFSGQVGFDLRADVLRSLGDRWCVYNSPGEGGLVVTGLTAVVEIKDRQRLAAANAKFVARLQEELGRAVGRADAFGEELGPPPRMRPGPRIEQFEFAGQEVFFFNAREDEFPFAPSWCLTEDELVVALFPQNIKAYLSRTIAHRSLAEVPEVARVFQSGNGPVAISYVDMPTVAEMFYPLAPMFAQVLSGELAREGIDVDVSILPSARAILPHVRPSVGVLRRTESGIELMSSQTLPGGNLGATLPMAAPAIVFGAREARIEARRAQSLNNLHQLGLALHNYHERDGHFPAAYTTDEDGKPLLSWRVQILPYLGYKPLYDQFHLDEPWDSEHNRQLVARMPQVFRSPASKAEPGKTNYLGVGGPGGIFAGKDGVRLAEIRDGTANTVMVVEASDESAVIWTKPEDYVPDPDNPKKGLPGLWPDGFNALFGDGSVRFLHKGIDGEMLMRMFTRAGGEVVEHY